MCFCSLSLDISALNFASKVCPVHPAVFPFFLLPSSLFPPNSSPPLHRTEEELLQSLTFVLTFFFFLLFFYLPLLLPSSSLFLQKNPYRLDLNRLLFSSFDLLIRSEDHPFVPLAKGLGGIWKKKKKKGEN